MAKSNPRTDGLVREAISTILRENVSDPRLSMVTITEVKVTPDHDHATVFYSVVDPGLITSERNRDAGDHLPTVEEVGAGLESASSRLRSMLGAKVRMRRTPALKFVHDPVQEASTRVEELLRNLNKGQ